MSLEPGFYQIRIVSIDHPDPGVGGMFLTLRDGKVTVEALGPDTFDAQRWFVSSVGVPNVYKIEKFTIPGPKNGLREGLLGDANDVPVVFGPDPQDWLINNAGVGTNVYLISPNKRNPIGVEHLVGTKDADVVVQTFPVYPGDRPAWQFISIE